MKSLLKILFFILCISTKAVYCEYDIEKLTELKIGDKVAVWDASAKVDARIYFFTDASACHVCNLAISDIFENLSSKHRIEFVTFLHRADKELIEFTKKHYKWGFDVISDWLGVYMAHYKVKAIPLYIVTDYEGKVLAIDKAGGSKYSLHQLDSVVSNEIMMRENAGFTVGTNKFMREIKRTRLKFADGRNLSGDYNVDALVDERTGDIYLRTNFRCDIYVLDSNGKMKYEISDIYFKEWDCDFPYQMSWFEKDSVIAVYNLKYPGRVVILFDIINRNIVRKFTFSEFISEPYDYRQNSQIGIRGICLGNSLKFLSYSKFSKLSMKKYLTPMDPVLIVFDLNTNNGKVFGVADDLFSNFKAASWFKSKFIYNHPLIYSIQTFPQIVNIYDLDFKKINSFKLNLGTTFKLLQEDIMISETRDDEHMTQLTSRISYLYNFPKYDPNHDIFLFNYINWNYPKGVTNHLSREVKKDFYMHLTNSNGTPYFPEDIFMQNMGQPVHISGKHLWVIEIENYKMDLVLYELDIKL